MLFCRWTKNSVYQYKMVISIPNTKGELAKVLTYLAENGFYILGVDFGRQKHSYIQYCDIKYMSEWNDQKEISLKECVVQCKVYKWMHGKSSKYYYYWHRTLGIPAVILGALSGISTFVNLQDEENCDSGTMITGIIIGVVMFLVSVLIALASLLCQL